MSERFVPTKEQANDALLAMCFHAKATERETIDLLWRDRERLRTALVKHLERCVRPGEPVVAYVVGNIGKPTTDIIEGATKVIAAIDEARRHVVR